MNTIRKETYKRNEDGTTTLISVEDVVVEGPTQEELIAEKEAQLLSIYEEIQALKNEQNS